MTRRKKTKHITKNQESDQHIIANMGLFWHCEKVRWVGNRKIGRARLAGIRSSGKKAGEVDFWKQKGIYALYDDNYKLIYVGQAGNTGLGSRLKQHLNDMSGRWNMFSWFGMLKVTRQNKLVDTWQIKNTCRNHLADILEGIVITVSEPPMNGQGGRFGKRVELFLQTDDRIPDVSERKNIINEIDEKLVKHTKKLLNVIRKN